MKYWTYNCCDFTYPAPTDMYEARERVYEHQRDWHDGGSSWLPCKITEIEIEEDQP